MKQKIILYIATSLDGYIAGPDGNVRFLDGYGDAGEDYGYGELLSSIKNVLIGNTTFRQFGAPYPGKNIFVFSRQNQIDTDRVRYIKGDIKPFAETLEGDSWLVGGASLLHSFLQAGKVDELIITIMPVLLGDGILLFNPGLATTNLNLAGSTSFDRGVIQLRYRNGPG